MTETIKSLIVGIVQGLTEFLPVSSSGHIVIAQEILGLDFGEDNNLAFAVLLHLATALSTIVVFYKDILDIFKGLFQFKWNKETQFALMIVISMIPAALVGMFLKDQVEEMFNNLLIVGICLLVTSCLLFFADKAKKSEKDVSFGSSLIIGIGQAFAALLPGLSRSGTTISTSIILGIDKAKAARFSFLMVLPLILGAALKEVLDANKVGATIGQGVEVLPLVVGFLAAFIAGLFACKWMISIVRRSKLIYFAVYCLIVGVAVITYKLGGF